MIEQMTSKQIKDLVESDFQVSSLSEQLEQVKISYQNNFDQDFENFCKRMIEQLDEAIHGRTKTIA